MCPKVLQLENRDLTIKENVLQLHDFQLFGYLNFSYVDVFGHLAIHLIVHVHVKKKKSINRVEGFATKGCFQFCNSIKGVR